MKFTAIYVEPTQNPLITNMLFADPETNPDEPAVLSFSRAVEFEDSSYYFEINDQSYGSYGGLEVVELSRNTVVIRLDAGLVAEFGNDDFAEVEVAFEVDDEMYQAVLSAMKAIFATADILVLVG